MVAALTLAACLRAPNVRAPSAFTPGNDRASDYDDLSADLRQDPAMAAVLEEAARRRIQVWRRDRCVRRGRLVHDRGDAFAA